MRLVNVRHAVYDRWAPTAACQAPAASGPTQPGWLLGALTPHSTAAQMPSLFRAHCCCRRPHALEHPHHHGLRSTLKPARVPAVCSTQLPRHPLRALFGTFMASLLLTTTLNTLAVRFQIDSWEEGLQMAALLLVLDACLNAR